MARRKTASADNIPLRLRRRRDGALYLMDALGRTDSDELAFPSAHIFTAAWLLREGREHAAISGDSLTVTLANASATYAIDEIDASGNVHVTLQATEVEA
jgi:hypothetical protein